MLISLVERFQEESNREIVRYGAWAAALRRFKIDCVTKSLPPIPDFESYLNLIPEFQRFEVLCDLLASHLEYSWTLERGAMLTDYLGRFPGIDSFDDLPSDLVEDEFLARYQRPHGDCPDLQEYERRFTGRLDVLDRLQQHSLDCGNYIKLHRIAAGVSGVVWEGYDHRSDQAVAIKIPHQDPNFEHLCWLEVEITSTLNHPGIVRTVEVGSSSHDSRFYVMRLAGRENFSERIQRHHQDLRERKKSFGKRHEWEYLLKMAVDVCEAIEYAHVQGVLHCDLKPGNVICGENGEIGVIDWGMARRITELENSNPRGDGKPLGTPEYMPPEQADGIGDVRSDVFGLGAILYETLTGRTPSSWVESGVGIRPEGWVDQVRSCLFPRPRKLNRKIPRQLEKICLKAMALKPGDRFQSASEFAEALRDYIDGDGWTIHWKT